MMNDNMATDVSVKKDFIEQLKKRAAELLFDALIAGLDNGSLSFEDSKKSARKIEMHIDQLESPEELLVFLRSLDQKYPSFRSVFIKFKAEETLLEDKIKLESVQQRLKNLTANYAG